MDLTGNAENVQTDQKSSEQRVKIVQEKLRQDVPVPFESSSHEGMETRI